MEFHAQTLCKLEEISEKHSQKLEKWLPLFYKMKKKMH